MNLSTIQVDTLVDENDGDLSNGDVSLREAIAAVENNGTITFDNDLATQDAGFGIGTIGLELGALVINKSLEIKGLGAERLSISGNNTSGILTIDDGDTEREKTVAISDITLRDSNQGSAIYNLEHLSVANSLITGNQSGIQLGSEYYAYDYASRNTLTIQNSVIDNNRGSAISGRGESITITDSEIANNSGKGISSYGINITLVNSQVTGNQGTAISGGSNYFNRFIDVSITGTDISGNGGDGIYNRGNIQITDSRITQNAGNAVSVVSYSRRGNATASVVTITGSTLSDNGKFAAYSDLVSKAEVKDSVISGNGSGGLRISDVVVEASSIHNNNGIGIDGENIHVKNSTLAENTGGGIAQRPGNFAYGTGRSGRRTYDEKLSLIVSNSTISGNGSAAAQVGGILSDAYDPDDSGNYFARTFRLENTTISDNIGRQVGGVMVEPIVFEDFNNYEGIISNTIIAGNSGRAPDLKATSIISDGYNFIGDGSDVTGLTDTDLVGSRAQPLNPNLGQLQDNGGATRTQIPRANSLVIDAGNPSIMTGLDQRGDGFPRVLDGNGDGRAVIDIGAGEATGTVIRNVINGDNRRNRLLGKGGNDVINGFGSRDFLNGRGGDDLLFGGSQNDRIIGGSGDDVINGGRGSDRLSGNGGNDTFVYESVHDGRDRILDFRIGQDHIDLSAIFTQGQYDSPDVFADYIRLGQAANGSATRLSVLDIRASSNQQPIFRTLAVIEGVKMNHIDASSFVIQ